MNVIAKRTIIQYTEHYPVARVPLLVWLKEFEQSNFESFNELKERYGNAGLVANHGVIFNIKGNEFRLIVSVNFRTKSAYVIWFGTHKEYDKLDAANVKHTDL